MYELKITVNKVMGECTASPPMKPGDYFIVSDGDIRIPEGGYLCLWALQSMLPLIPAKEREIAEQKHEDWMWRVHHVQCPDPKGRVVFKIERTGKIRKNAEGATEAQDAHGPDKAGAFKSTEESGLKNLRIVVESVGGYCTSRIVSPRPSWRSCFPGCIQVFRSSPVRPLNPPK